MSLESFTAALRRDIRNVRYSKGTPKHINIYGYLYDIETGNLHLVEESLGDPKVPRGAPWR
jgi:carbonic anhydrase